MKEIAQITSLLKSDALERRVAAAIVLGELSAKGPGVVAGLTDVLGSNIGVLQRHALDALCKVGAAGALPQILPLCGSTSSEVREAALRAVASVGNEALPLIKQKLALATPDEKRALDAALAEIGGRDAFGELLRGLLASDADAAKAAALAVRQQAKGADVRQRKSYASAALKFWSDQEKKGCAPDSARAALLKLFGFLEDERAVPVLVAALCDSKASPAIRMEGILALRFVLKEADAQVTDALVAAANHQDRTLAQAALHTLGSVSLGGAALKRMAPLVMHQDADRACFAIEHIARQQAPEATGLLVRALSAKDKRVAETAAKVLGERKDSGPHLAKALLETDVPDRAWAIRSVLKPRVKALSPALRKELVADALGRIQEHDRGFEAHLDIAREADAEGVASGLRELAQKAKKGKNKERAQLLLHLLCKSDRATDEDRFALAVADLHKSPKDTTPAARQRDEALTRLSRLQDGGFDLLAALKKDKTLELDELYYVGFHFAERRATVGPELLGVVAQRGGRTKIAKMAKNKLKLVGETS